MNKTPSEAVELVNMLKPLCANEDVDVVFCVPAIDIIPAMEAAKGSNIAIGAENMYYEESGAYTGEISPAMLVDAGVKYVVLGHSERREYFAETDETVNKKVLKAFEHGITPIVCCGETLAQREQGVTIDFVRQQIKIAFLNVPADKAAEAVVDAVKDGPFLSKDDFRNRTKVSKTVVDLLSDLNILDSLPESNQLSLFDFAV